MWSGRVLAKYWALQLPGTVLVIAVLLAFEDDLAWPRWLVWTIAAAWVAKDAILYPFVWRSYDPREPARFPYPMEGAKAVAVERIDPRGRVRISGELWRAELAPGARPIEEGETVKVDARRRFTLLVEPEKDLAVRSPLHDHVAENRETR
jgi:membrane protein implicated in regulation of membrane protease activity